MQQITKLGEEQINKQNKTATTIYHPLISSLANKPLAGYLTSSTFANWISQFFNGNLSILILS
jgi:hypothetical protein